MKNILGIPNSGSVVAALPANFDLSASIRNASSIRLATAFAKLKGWEYLSDDLLSSKADIKLLTGLYFCQTEPRLLSHWLSLASDTITARVFNAPTSCFHPKVLIVEEADGTAFAVVGSANLTKAAFTSNIECGLYVSDEPTLRSLTTWFDGLKSQPITKELIERYKLQFERAESLKRDPLISNMFREERPTRKELISNKELLIEGPLLSEASFYRQTKDYIDDLKKTATAISSLKEALNYPALTFSIEGWKEFSRIPQFGWLDQRSAAQIDPARLAKALRYLIEIPDETASRLHEVLNDEGKYRIKSIGINSVTKFLLMHDPQFWPVINGPVRSLLEEVGCKLPQTIRAGEYLDIRSQLEALKSAAGLQDFSSMDAFFNYRSHPQFRNIWEKRK